MASTTVTSLTPYYGPTAGDTPITITGTGLLQVNNVLFGAVGAWPPTAQSDTQIVIPSPLDQPAGQVSVQVNLPTGPIPAGAFTYVAPTVTSLTPGSGSTAGGTPVTIAGTGLLPVDNVLFGAVGAWPPTSQSDTRIVIPSPLNQPAGLVSVQVNLPTGSIPAGAFTYEATPSVISIAPGTGPNAGQTPVTVTGTGFAASSGVSFGANPAASVTFNNATSLTATSPSGGGTVDILVTNASGTSDPVGADQFSYASLPFTFGIPDDVASQDGVFLTMYGQLAAAYTNGAGTTIPVGGNVYLTTIQGVYDYAPTAGLPVGTSLTPFFSTQSGDPSVPVDLPNVQLQAGRVVVGIGAAAIADVNDAGGDVSAPTPGLEGSNIYDFFEFSLLPVAGLMTLTINTSAIDQFGLPIGLAVEGASVAPSFPVGVVLPRQTIVGGSGQFAQAMNANPAGAPWVALTQDSFGTAQDVRIWSPAQNLATNPVQGLTVSPGAVSGSLSSTTSYSYVMTATNGTVDAPAACQLAQSAAGPAGSVDVAWGPSGDANVTGYELYRATPAGASVTWALVTTLSGGDAGSYTDTGGGTSSAAPSFDALGGYFDQSIADLFTTYVAGGPPLSVTVTDGSSPANGFQYTFIGTAVPAPVPIEAPGNTVLQFQCTSIANNPDGDPTPIPLNAYCFVVSPFFNTNTLNPANPSPPGWLLDADTFPTAMAFGANGVFADNAQQAAALCNNAIEPSGGVLQSAYSVALGAIENQIDAALLRGVATTVSSINWANAPTNLAAGAGSAAGGTLLGQTYYYVVTTLNSAGESTPSNEAGFLPSTGSIQLSWDPVSGAAGYNVYRGAAPGGENQLIGATQTPSYTDSVAAPGCCTASPPSPGAEPTPGGVAATLATGGSLPSGQTYYYVVTALGVFGESGASQEVSGTTAGGSNSIALSWQASANTAAYKIYRGTASGQENLLIGTSQGTGLTFTDTGSAAQVPPPIIYYAPGTVCDLYAQYFHQPGVSAGGLAYTAPFDDQGGQSSTIAGISPTSVTVTLGPWT